MTQSDQMGPPWANGLRLLAHLEDQVVPEDKVGDAGYKNEDGREDSSPQEDDAIRFWQLHQVSDLEASDVIH